MKKLLLIGGLFCASFSFSQIELSRDVFASAGMEMNNAALQVSFTMGESFTSTFSPGATHTLGFQQGERSNAFLNEASTLVFSLFPNPADEQITFTASSDASFVYRIYDVTGRIVRNGRNTSGTLTLDVSEIVEGKYFLEYIPESGQTQYLPFITLH